jgi:protein-S-isoprenylcysteine O-methyltransferase Ste14
MLRALEVVFAAGWAAFWVYWIVAARSIKRGQIPWSRGLLIRAVLLIIVIVLVRLGVFRHDEVNTNAARAAVGLVLFAIGLAFAVWARVSIGRNWGMPMTEQNEPELVTSGAYRLVRHPIYSGLLLAATGTAVALSWIWLIAVGLAGSYFVYSAVIEERFLIAQFPETYLAYRRSSKMLVPFVF